MANPPSKDIPDPKDADPLQQDLVQPAEPTPPAGHPLPEPAALVGAESIEVEPKKVWRVGTLVYATGGLVVLFCWLLWGDFALSMRDRSVGPLIEKFLLRHGASNTLKQLLTATLPTIISLILGPIVSYRSDRTRSRWGRRIPYLIIPTPVAGLAMIGIAFCPQIGEWLYHVMGNVQPQGVSLHLAASNYTMATFTVFWTIFEVAVIISGSVFGGLINDVVPRPVLGRFHGLFRAISLYDGILFNALLFKHAEQHFTLMFALIGILFGGGFTLMCLKVKEGQYPTPTDVDSTQTSADGIANRFFHAVVIFFKECFTRPYYLLLFVMFLLANLTFRPINDFSIRYKEQLGLSDADYGFIVAGSYLISLTIAFPLGMLVDLVHALRASLVGMFLYILTVLYGGLFVHDAASFGLAFFLHVVLSGTYFTCSASLAQALYPRSKFSQYSSAGGILNSFSGLIFAPAMGLMLDMTNDNYHLTFWVGLALSALTFVTMMVVYFRFIAYGGPKGYLAPGDDETVPARHEPPKHMWQIILPYLAGAFSGIAVGYVAAYFFYPHEPVSFLEFPNLLLRDKPIRDMTLFWTATGLLPGAVIGAYLGTRFVNRSAPHA